MRQLIHPALYDFMQKHIDRLTSLINLATAVVAFIHAWHGPGFYL